MSNSMGLQAMTGETGQDEGAKPAPAAAASGLRGRNLLLGGALVFLVLLLYAVSFVKVPPGPGDGPPADAADRGPGQAVQPVPATQPLSGIRRE